MDRQNLDLYGCPLFSTPSCKQWTFLVSQTDTVGMANFSRSAFHFSRVSMEFNTSTKFNDFRYLNFINEQFGTTRPKSS